MMLSDGEKLIACMLADIAQHLDAETEINPEFIKEAICSGHSWALRIEARGVFESEETAQEVVKETADILNMCRIIESAIEKLSEPERNQILPENRQVFVGFDANNEEHYGVAFMYLQKLDRWQEFKDRPLNSHSHTIDKYRRMKAVFDQSHPQIYNNLSFETITSILNA